MDQDASVKEFVKHYYSTLGANPADLGSLYREGSMLTFQGQNCKGKESILAKLTSLPFQQCQLSITTVDSLPSIPAGSVIAFVKGNVRLDGWAYALDFSQTFFLMPTPQGGFYIWNDIFRVDKTAQLQSVVAEGAPAQVLQQFLNL